MTADVLIIRREHTYKPLGNSPHDNWDKEMSRHFMLYWKPETVEWHLACDFFLRNAGSNQLSRVAEGDTLWIVTTGEGDELCLAGRLRVGEIVSFKEAQKRLGTANLWKAKYHALAEAGTAVRMRGISLADLAAELRFIDEDAESLQVTEDGAVHPVQLKRMRELNNESAGLLKVKWMKSSL